MAEQKARARQDALKQRGNVDLDLYDDAVSKLTTPIKFVGYEKSSIRARVIDILTQDGPVDEVKAPADVEVVLNVTPFYAERGGQLADRGEILSDEGGVFEVDDVQTPVKGLRVHAGRLTDGELRVGDEVSASIDTDRRAALARSHTATHILHRALRDVLGEQATQRGSVVAPDFLHFDYQWPTAPTREQLDEVEREVNEKIMDDLPVTATEMPIKDAEDLGADHLFGSKYGDIVRVVTIGEDGWSRELCGGTHLDRTGKAGNFVITGEFSNGSGVRRIDAYMGMKGYEYNNGEHARVADLASRYNVQQEDVVSRVDQLAEQLKAAQHKLAEISAAQLEQAVPQMVEQAKKAGGDVFVAVRNAGELGDVASVRQMAMEVRSRLGEDDPVVVALAGTGTRATRRCSWR